MPRSKIYVGKGVACVGTRALTLGEVTRRRAEIIHLEAYEDLCDRRSRKEEIVDERGGESGQPDSGRKIGLPAGGEPDPAAN